VVRGKILAKIGVAVQRNVTDKVLQHEHNENGPFKYRSEIVSSPVLTSAPVTAAGSAGFVDHNFTQFRQIRLEPLPNPQCELLAGRIFQPFDVVQVMVIQLIVDGPEGAFDVGKVHDPAGIGCRFTCDMDFYPEGMPVQASAFMTCRNIRQAMRGFHGKDFENIHWRIIDEVPDSGKTQRKASRVPVPWVDAVKQME
jgi:hypothetical protein